MSKKGPLSKEEKAFIDNNSNLSNEQLAEKLDRSIKTVSNYNKKSSAAQEKRSNQTAPSNDIDLYARNKERGVVVMTENASIVSDEKKKKTNIMNTRKYRDIIHKIKED